MALALDLAVAVAVAVALALALALAYALLPRLPYLPPFHVLDIGTKLFIWTSESIAINESINKSINALAEHSQNRRQMNFSAGFVCVEVSMSDCCGSHGLKRHTRRETR